MDELSGSLPQLGIILACAVAGTVFLIQKAKMLVCKHFKGKWTQRIPPWFWLGASIVIPFGIVLLMLQPWMQGWLNTLLPSSMQLAVTPSDVFATGFSAVVGSNGAYAAAKKLGLAADYSAGGPNDVSTPTPEAPMAQSIAQVIEPAIEPASIPVDVAQMPVAAPDAITPTPQPDTQEACTMDAALLFRADGSPAYVELSSPSGKWKVVRINT